ncbi:hypothetical protein Tco_1552347 [Tanacetum coccineum]
MGKIANVYVSKRKNKLGQMFAFCRYNKIDNKEALIDSLNMIWIGKLRLHTNIARFNRKEGVKHVHADVKRQVLYDYKPIEHSDVNSKSYANRVKSQHTEDRKVNEGEPVIESPSIMLYQEASSGLSLALIGCYKDFRAIGNSRITCRNEGFVGVETKYLGGLWVLFEFYYRDTRDRFLKHEGVLSWGFLMLSGLESYVVGDQVSQSVMRKMRRNNQWAGTGRLGCLGGLPPASPPYQLSSSESSLDKTSSTLVLGFTSSSSDTTKWGKKEAGSSPPLSGKWAAVEN